MIQNISADTAHTMQIAAEFAIQGKLLGSLGAGGVASALTVAMVAGIREPKGGGEGAKKGKMRRKLTSTQATTMGVVAGTFYAAAGSIWKTSGQVSDAFAQVFTSGAFGTAGLGAVSLLLAAVIYFREMRPGAAAFTGVLSAGVWAAAGGIWGLPEALVLSGAHAVGAL
ncbi:hypothetical protein ACGFWI_37855 [Streptomyces sp. NPDC048434]|uniref:hypothetical protein n=1 Tax=Streptomyces sp. NPDC048434 TaxID=3365549 RepID=UPI00371A8C23